MISFSSGCVINLDDLGEFPDYLEVIMKIRDSIKENKIDWSSMETFLDADMEDVQHIPEFKDLMTEMIDNYDSIFTSKKEIKDKFIILLLRMMKDYYVSYRMDEQEVAPILSILLKELQDYTEYFCDFWLNISKFAPYVEKHDEIVNLFLHVVNEKQIFRSEDMSLAYVKSVDKILRFRMFRQAFQKAINHLEAEMESESKFKPTPFLKFKLSLYLDKNAPQLAQHHYEALAKFIGSTNQSSNYIREYIEKKKLQLI